MKYFSEDRASDRSQPSFQSKAFRLLAVSALAMAAHPVLAQSALPTIEEIPTFDDLDPAARSEAYAVSGDGTVVVGEAYITGGFARAFAFSSGTLTNLDPAAPTPSFSRATDVNQDGSVISGIQQTLSGTSAFYWTQATGLVTFSNPPGEQSFGNAVSGDGTSILGTQFGSSNPAAFVWTRATNAVTYLSPLIPGGFTFGNDISSDGTVVVGEANTAAGPVHAFRAVVGSSTTDLGSLNGASGNSTANGVSADGLVVVGRSSTSSSGTRAFRWSQGTAMVQLNAPDEADTSISEAFAASADGSYVAGYASIISTGTTRALRWDSTGAAIDLGDLTSDNSGISYARGISDDGTIIVGTATNDAGDTRGFIWRDVVEEPAGTMLDHVNTLTQVANNAAEQAAGALYLDNLVRFTLGQSLELPVDGGQGSRSKAGLGRPYSLKVAAGAANNRDGNDTALLGLMAATALNDNLSLGGFVGLGNDDDTLTGFGIDGTFRSFGVYLQGGHPSTEGLNWKLATARTAAEVDITRSTALANTERGTGTTDMSAHATSIELGYGMQRGAALVTPFMRVTRSSVQRDGYTETGAVAFPVTYDDYEVSATIATLGADVRIPVSDAGVVRLNAGVDWDLSRSTNTVSGTSAIPGMTTFAIAGPALENEKRLFAEAHYTHSLGNGRSYDVGLGVNQTAYADKPSVMATVGYQMDF